MENIKIRLKEILEDIDLKQLSDYLNIDVSIIYTWLRGEYIPSTLNFIGISKFCNYSIEYLLNRTDDYGDSKVEINSFYNNLEKIMVSRKKSFKQMKKDKIISANNIFKWKRGEMV